MRFRRLVLGAMLVAISGIGAGGCVSYDVRRRTASMADYQGRFDRQKANTSMTDDMPETLPDMTAEDYTRVGDQYFFQNDLPMAFVHYDKALRMSPDRVNVKYKQGLVFLKRGLTEDARRVFQDVLKIDDTFALPYEGMGQAFLMMGHIREGQRCFRHAITLDPSLWKPHNFLGMIYDHQERFDDAIIFYKFATALEKNNGLLWNNLGVSYYKKGDYDRASQALQKALQLQSADAKDAKIYNNLGLSLAKLGRYQEALIAFTQGSSPAQAYNNLGVIYLTEKKYKEAAAAFEEAIALSPKYYKTASDNLRIAQQALGASHTRPDRLSTWPAESDLQ